MVVVFNTRVCVIEPEVTVVRIRPFVELAVYVEFESARTADRAASRPRRKNKDLGNCIMRTNYF